MSYSLNPIGEIDVGDDGFTLHIEELYRPALTELDGFSHINVLWWCHYLDEPQYRQMTVVEKPYREGPAQVGIFATRSPARPNPIAVTVTSLISVDIESGIVEVGFLDAEPGTPILDIKPYLLATDRVRDVSTPAWCAGWPQWLEESATFDWAAVFENAQ